MKRSLYEEVLFETVRHAATTIPDDVLEALDRAIERESLPEARQGLEETRRSLKKSRELQNPACPDTGWPLFYFKVGNDCRLEGGLMGLEEAARAAVARAAAEGYIRATMKHPLTGYDPGNNVGNNIPSFTYKFVPGNSIEITYVPKGGGSEVFGGSRLRTVAFADGIQGIEKFIIDAFVDATRVGAICPPNIVGVGIGGTANICANLAKEAACLRPAGSEHPEAPFRQIEKDLYEALNSLGVGVLGVGGNTSVLAVNVEYAYTHIAGICVAMACNCMVARRATYRIDGDGTVQCLKTPNWFGGR
jgi:tartrate/fumarate subfamily iron-sulfur-dependent hydro-lyase alpha chain